LALVVLLSTALLCWEFRRPWFQGNLGILDPGHVIRSAQPTTQLARWVHDYQIHSILNLRGGSPSDWWYAAEVRTAREWDVDLYDLPLIATRRPRRRELLALIDILDSCRYPLLIHCKSGADRTGLAAALYLMIGRAEPPERALRSFSLEYGHVPIGGPEHLHEPLDEYAAWLKRQNLPHTPARFRAWVENEYQPRP
jgi:protein tyrosine/serine phosphatase